MRYSARPSVAVGPAGLVYTVAGADWLVYIQGKVFRGNIDVYLFPFFFGMTLHLF